MHSVLLKSDGTVWGWGDRGLEYAQSGRRGGSSVPLEVKALSGVVAIAADDQRSAALKKDGTVWFWGSCMCGKSGIGMDEYAKVPCLVLGQQLLRV